MTVGTTVFGPLCPKTVVSKVKKWAIISTGANFWLIIVLIPAVLALQEGVIAVLVLTTPECPAGYVVFRPTFVKYLIGEATKFMACTVIRVSRFN